MHPITKKINHKELKIHDTVSIYGIEWVVKGRIEHNYDHQSPPGFGYGELTLWNSRLHRDMVVRVTPESEFDLVFDRIP